MESDLIGDSTHYDISEDSDVSENHNYEIR